MRRLIGSRRRVLVVACDGFVNQGFPDDQSGSWTQDFETIKRLCASALRRPLHMRGSGWGGHFRGLPRSAHPRSGGKL
jgi:hypothetical protein